MVHSTLVILTILFRFNTPDPPRFESQLLDDKVAIGYGLAIGDVDGDGKPDILLADKKEFVWYRNGDWRRFVMVENLTESDNVCIAARDINGDGKVEVAVGAQWNPGETSDTTRSGAVYYLSRPDDPTKNWKPVQLHHEPVTHRMRWVKTSANKYQLVVLPLHGRGNKGGEGKGVKIFAYEMADNPEKPWKLRLLDEEMHLTHNLDVVPDGNTEMVYVGGKEGIKVFTFKGNRWTSAVAGSWLVRDQGFGELRAGAKDFVAGIQPMHGNELTVYTPSGQQGIKLSSPLDFERTVLTDEFKQGHALGTADFTGVGNLQIVAGWREPDANGKVGVKLFVPEGKDYLRWTDHWIDENDMACEDLQVADLNADGKVDIIAAGRNSHNLKIYWNRN